MSLITYLPHDIKTMIYLAVHREFLRATIKEMFQLLSWDDSVMHYYFNYERERGGIAFNGRTKQYNTWIFNYNRFVKVSPFTVIRHGKLVLESVECDLPKNY